MPEIKIKQILEHEITCECHGQLTALRNECFPDHQVPRSYAKQLPHFRLIAFDQDRVVGQLGVDHRMIAIGGQPFRIFGVIDLCVSQAYQGQGVAGMMLDHLSELAERHEMDLLLLFADDHRLYERHGYQLISRDVMWLRIHDYKNLGVAMEKMERELLVREVSDRSLPEGPVDMLGYLF